MCEGTLAANQRTHDRGPGGAPAVGKSQEIEVPRTRALGADREAGSPEPGWRAAGGEETSRRWSQGARREVGVGRKQESAARPAQVETGKWHLPPSGMGLGAGPRSTWHKVVQLSQ